MADVDYAVIMAGGKGERFWPLSTSRRPKQLLSLVGEETLLAQAVNRLTGLIPPERVFVITNADLVEASRAAAPTVPPENIIGEPVGRDTAAAIALGALLVQARDPDACFCVLTADHVIGDLDLYREVLRQSLHYARKENVLITIGMQPDTPSTGYGYIRSGSAVHEQSGISFLKAEQFVEKPDAATAQSYLDSGDYYWNSGMFIWSAQSLEKALRKHQPALGELMDRLRPVIGTDQFMEGLTEAYASISKISIDYALMEKADNIVMVRGTFAWDDVGSWPALARHFAADAANNVAIGSSAAHDSSGNIVYSKGRLTALVGVQDMIVVQTDGVTLICPRDRAQEVKKLVEQLKQSGNYDEVL